MSGATGPLLLVYPGPPPGRLADVLAGAGYRVAAFADPPAAEEGEPEEGFAGAVVAVAQDPEPALSFCRAMRKRENPLSPLLVVVGAGQIGDLEARDELYDDFVLAEASAEELARRIAHLLWSTGRGKGHQVIAYGPLALNLETYQAVLDGRPLDLTYMEYELLRFLAAHPGRVFTREVLLSRVWGYEYFGGARTVDVHVRRLRAKLGEEHAGMIDTVRSVGYRFGTARWVP